jgi:nitrate reductase molybdenum cofactor assembly chaperone NarJ/NarW
MFRRSAPASSGRSPARSGDGARHRVLYQAVSVCLSYPDDAVLDRLPLVRAALGESGATGSARAAGTAAAGVLRFLDHAQSTPAARLQLDYVETFDLSRRHALHLSYWTDGDTRRRGEVLGRFKQAYRDSGLLVTPGGELPDFLPMVLEFAAVADPEAGRRILIEYRPSLELLRLALEEADSPYAGMLADICSTLPGESPADRQAVMAMAGHGPPQESVGLEPFDPRLLPVRGT